VGEAHVLHLPCTEGAVTDLALEFDVEAAVTPARSEQVIEVSVDGQVLEIWTFSRSDNRGVRRLLVPAELAGKRPAQGNAISIEFRPRSVKSVAEIAPGSADTRALGLGLHRIRLRGD
jgi:hypothetical protein